MTPEELRRSALSEACSLHDGLAAGPVDAHAIVRTAKAFADFLTDAPAVGGGAGGSGGGGGSSWKSVTLSPEKPIVVIEIRGRDVTVYRDQT